MPFELSSLLVEDKLKRKPYRVSFGVLYHDADFARVISPNFSGKKKFFTYRFEQEGLKLQYEPDLKLSVEFKSLLSKLFKIDSETKIVELNTLFHPGIRFSTLEQAKVFQVEMSRYLKELWQAEYLLYIEQKLSYNDFCGKMGYTLQGKTIEDNAIKAIDYQREQR